MNSAQGLVCPIDASPLSVENRSLVCCHNHRFDIAKQGYCNLLPVQNKRSADPGDSKAMVQARTALLDSGCYVPIVDALTAVIHHYANEVDTAQSLTLVDAGCGEGYYAQQLKSRCDIPLDCIGFDISKWAIQGACRRSKDIRWLVASSKKMPIADQYADVLLCMFGFPVYSEFYRTLKQDGLLILVDAGPTHLIELRERIYDTIKPAKVWQQQPLIEAGFYESRPSEAKQFQVTLNQQQLQQLLLMTPHFFRASQQAKSELQALTELTVTVDIVIRQYKAQ